MNDLLAPDLFDRIEPGARKASKRQILRSALACFDELGVDATPIDTIRERASSSIGSIYHHFGNKEGLIAALYLAALDDQIALMLPAMNKAATPKAAIAALIQAYLRWVTQQPELARFLFQVRHSVATGPRREELTERNKQRYQALLSWLKQGVKEGSIRALPSETYASLLIGQAENYCKAWLSGRVKGRPLDYAETFTEAAWRSVGHGSPHPGGWDEHRGQRGVDEDRRGA